MGMNTMRRFGLGLLVLALGLTGCGSQDPAADPEPSDGASSPAAREVATNIPRDLPLGLGMTRDEDVPGLATSDEPGISEFRFCGSDPFADTSPTDVRSVDHSGGEAADTRDLRVFATVEEARALAESIRTLAESCPVQDTEAIARTHNEVRPSTLAGAPSLVVVQTWSTDGEVGPDVTVSHVVQAGNAVLVTQTYAQAPGPALEDFVDDTTTELGRTVAAMSVFDDGTTPSPAPEAESPATASPEIPADFPLAVDMPREDGDFLVMPPSVDGEGLGQVAVCGRDVWPTGGAGGTARLVTTADGPEWQDARELYAYADHEVAQEAMAGLEQARTCEEFENQIWHSFDLDTGYESVTHALTYSDGMGSSVFQWTRVGSAIVLVMSYREGSAADVEAQAQELVRTTRTLAREMCVFSVAGC